MKKFLVKVNGQELEVEVKELNKTTSIKAPTSPKPSNQQTTRNNSGNVISPMSGAIVAIHVKVGDLVTADKAVLTIEAMKMENEIVAGKAGTITKINVSVGQNVNGNELLIVIE